MRKSDDIKELTSALVRAQAEMKPAVKGTENPFFQSHYADLASVMEACRDPLSKNGLAVLQVPGIEDGKPVIETVLSHSSGQWISGVYPIVALKQDPQSLGSATSYARRYSLAAMVCVVTEDDDAERAMSRDSASHVNRPPAQPGRGRVGGPSEPQIKRLWAIAHKVGWNQTNVMDFISREFKKTSLSDLNRQEYDRTCTFMEFEATSQLGH